MQRVARSSWSFLAGIVLLGTTATTVAGEQAREHPAPATDTGSIGPVTSATLVDGVLRDGMEAMQLARLALERSADARIRGFAELMLRDHDKVNQDLAALARRKSLPVPEHVGEYQGTIDHLGGHTGAVFDAAYAEHALVDHGKVIALLRAALGSGAVDGELQAFAARLLPLFEEHRRMAAELTKRP